MTADAIDLAEFQRRYDDDQPADVTWGQLRAYRKAAWQLAEVLDTAGPPGYTVGQATDLAADCARKLTRLGSAVDAYLHGRSSIAELRDALDASGALQ